MDKNIETVLSKVENIKDKLTDNEYKELIESLGTVHKQKQYNSWKLIIKYSEIEQIPFLHSEEMCDMMDCKGDSRECPFENEVYCLNTVFKTDEESIYTDKNSRLDEVLMLNNRKTNYSKHFFNDIVLMMDNEEIDGAFTSRLIHQKEPILKEIIFSKTKHSYVSFKTFHSIEIIIDN